MNEMTELSAYGTAENFCEAFAQEHSIQFIRYGTCGFGRHCSGFSKDGIWISYNPHRAEYDTATALNPSKFPAVPEFSKVHLSAPEGVEAYHKDDFLCVLHGGGEIDPEIFGKIFGGGEPDDVIIEIPDREKPQTPQMQEAVIQLCKWIIYLQEIAEQNESQLFVGKFNTGYRGIQAMLSGQYAPAIGVR